MATLADLAAVTTNASGTPQVDLTFPSGTLSVPLVLVRQQPALLYLKLNFLGFILDNDFGAQSQKLAHACSNRIMEQVDTVITPLPPVATAVVTTAPGTDAVPAVGTLGGVFLQNQVVTVDITHSVSGLKQLTIAPGIQQSASQIANRIASAVNAANTDVIATVNGLTVEFLTSVNPDTLNLDVFSVV